MTRTAGRFGGGLAFNGSASTVTIPHSASLNLTSRLTLLAWVRPTTTSGWRTALLKERTNGFAYGLYTSTDTGVPAAFLRIGSSDRAVLASSSLAPDVWSHVAMTYDGAALRLYVDGTQVASRPQTGAVVSSTGALRIGGNSVWGEYFSGTLDEVRVYNRALTAAEIAQDRDTPVNPQNARLVITAPAPGATVTGPAVDVSYAIAGTLTGEEDHVHFVIDGTTVMDPPPMDGVYRFGQLAAGDHILGGYLARADHSHIAGTDAPAVSFSVLGPDTTGPTVTSTNPAAGAAGISSTTSVSATFSEALDAASVTGQTVKLQASGQPVSATVTYVAASRTVLLTPGAALAPATIHTVTLVGGGAGIRDLAGNVLGADVQWTFTTAAAPPPPPPTNGLVAAYGFEEGSGTNVADSSTFANHGTVTGATWSAAGRFGKALQFNGSSNWVTVGDSSSLDLTTGMTLAAWVYPTALSGFRTALLKETPGELAYALYAHDGAPRPSAYVNNGGSSDPTVGGPASLSLNTWTHLATTYDGATLRLFVNGAQVATRPVSGSLINSAGPLRVGGNAVWGEYFAGRIDEVRVYNRALVGSEIAADMATPIAASSGGDTAPPAVAITAPPPATTVSGTVTLTASASDNVGVAGVQFTLDGGNLGAEDTATPYSHAWNTAAVSNGIHTLSAIARDAAGNQTTAATVSVTVANGTNPAQVGAWSQPVELGMVGVHMILLPTGRLLMWGGENHGGDTAQVWDPYTFSIKPVPSPTTNLFCAGHARLADGRIFVAGGHDSDNGVLGAADANIFDPITESWLSVPNMSFRRWYPTTTALPDGRMLVTSGGTTCFACIADIPEVYNPTTNTWTRLNAARWAFPYYPFIFVLPDGRVLNAGAGENPVETRVLDVGTQAWTTVDANVVDGGSAVMFRTGKILKTGTSATTDISNLPAAATAYVLDMNAATPRWRQTAPMAFPRAYHNSTILPDGTVLITGGGTRTEGKNVAYAVYEAELWSPDTETFNTMARMTVPRQYHGTALLLPDGRVVVAGSGDSYGGPNQTRAEFYSPPYLFKGSRPVIASAPGTIQYGTAFSVTSPQTASIASISLIRLGSVTHQFDQDQRFVTLAFTKNGNTLTVDAPANANIAPPGHYMLFLVDGAGVPSIASIVQLPLSTGDTLAPTAPAGLTATGGAARVDLQWLESTDENGVARYNVHRDITSGFAPTAANRIATPASPTYFDGGLAPGTYYYRVTAQDVAGNVSPSSNQASAAAVGDLVPPSVNLLEPAAGATLSGSHLLSATASDDSGTVGVQFLLDGIALGSRDDTTPYELSWNTASTPNGPHTIAARAIDGAGNVTTSVAVTVSVDNPVGLPADLVASWNFNDGTGAVAADQSGNGHTATLAGAAWSATGRYGGALAFNGNTAHLAVQDAAALDLSTFTIEAWVNPTTLSGWRTIVMKETSIGLSYALYGHDNAPHPAAYVNVGGVDRGVAGESALPLNMWSHLAVTHDGSTLRLYVNAVLAGQQAVSGSAQPSTGPLTIGGNNVWGEHFAGLIDEVRIFRRALTGDELAAEMNSPGQP